jgi:hypothetical protein
MAYNLLLFTTLGATATAVKEPCFLQRLASVSWLVLTTGHYPLLICCLTLELDKVALLCLTDGKPEDQGEKLGSR